MPAGLQIERMIPHIGGFRAVTDRIYRSTFPKSEIDGSLKICKIKINTNSKEDTKDAGCRWNQGSKDVLLRYATADTGIFS